jgi:hypothetical protein
MKRALLTFVVLASATGGLPGRADEDPKKSAAAKENGGGAYLGVAVEPLPAALRSQLAGILPKGGGLLVAQVAKDSPAATAGVQMNDILVRYAGHELHSPQELIKLARHDTPGHEVKLDLVRGGKTMACKVALGQRPSSVSLPRRRVFRLSPDEQFREFLDESGLRDDGSAWESFDELKLTRLNGKRWRAEIDYRGKDGKKEHKVFEGTRHEIRKDIHSEKDLPANERRHLLRTLNMHEPVFEFRLPPFDNLDSSEQP